MRAQKIDGRTAARQLKADLTAALQQLPEDGLGIGLATVMVTAPADGPAGRPERRSDRRNVRG